MHHRHSPSRRAAGRRSFRASRARLPRPKPRERALESPRSAADELRAALPPDVRWMVAAYGD